MQTSTTNIGAYMWSAVAAERLGLIGRRELRRAAGPHAHDARGDGAPRGDGPVLQLVRPPHRRQADDLAADRRAARRRSCPRSTTPGSRSACRIVRRAACRSSRARARRALRRDGLRLLLPARGQPDPLPLRAATRASAPCCYDTIVSESRIAYYVGVAKGDLPVEGLLRPVAHVPGQLRLVVAGDAPGRLHAHVRGRDRLRGHATRTTTGRGSCRAGAAACSRR